MLVSLMCKSCTHKNSVTAETKVINLMDDTVERLPLLLLFWCVKVVEVEVNDS